MRYISFIIPGSGNYFVNPPANVPSNGTTSLSDALGVGIQLLIIAGIILALFFFVWGGIDWITSGGNKQKLDQARQKIFYAIIGLVVIFLAFFVVNTIFTLISNSGGGGGGGIFRCGRLFCT